MEPAEELKSPAMKLERKKQVTSKDEHEFKDDSISHRDLSSRAHEENKVAASRLYLTNKFIGPFHFNMHVHYIGPYDPDQGLNPKRIKRLGAAADQLVLFEKILDETYP